MNLTEKYDSKTIEELYKAFEKLNQQPTDILTIEIIMAVEDSKTRHRLIAENIHLFNHEAPDAPLVLVEVGGMRMTEEEANQYTKEQGRKKILAVTDRRERQQLIQNNLHLFN